MADQVGTERRHRAIACSLDTLIRQTASTSLTDAGFEVVGETGSVADLLNLARMVEPDLIVLDNDQPGRLGVDFLPEIREALPGVAVLVLANDEHIRDRAMEAGAFGVVYRTKMFELEGALGRTRQWLESPDSADPTERRTGKDRRYRQDWAQVTHERRDGDDRRTHDAPPPS